MTRTLLETIQQIVQSELGRVRTAELAVVQEVHPHAAASDTDNYACTVALRDSGLVLSHVPVATARIGTVSIPAVGELVLVQFLGGSVNAPVITGRLYNDVERPPVSTAGTAIAHLPLGAQAGEAVHIELRSGDVRSLSIALGDGLKLKLNDGEPAVALDVGDGSARLEISRDGATTLSSRSTIDIKGQGVTVDAQGETLVLRGAMVEIN